jgi:hypothetical protein
MAIEPRSIYHLVEQLRQIEHDILTGTADQMAEVDPQYSQQLADLKRATDDLRTSMWCAFVSKNSPDRVKQFVERHRMSRVMTLLRRQYPMGHPYGERTAVPQFENTQNNGTQTSTH